MIRTMAAVLFLVAALVPASPARAGDCKPVYGFYTSRQQACDAPFCTAGRLIGGLQGDYAFVQTSALPATAIGGDPVTLSSALFYVGRSDVTLASGDHVYASDSGVIDLPPPLGAPTSTSKQAALLVIHGGTGAHAAASGFLQLRGTLALDASTGTITVTGDYSGQVCTP